MKLKKCLDHKPAVYTLKENCPICNQKTKDAHYKFIHLKSVKDGKQ